MAKPLTGKKEKVSTEKPESVLSVIKAGAQFVLMVFGIVGLAILIFSGDGLLVTLGGKLTQFDSFGSLMAIPLLIITIYIGRIWFEKAFGKSSSAAAGSFAMYLMMAVGAFFLYRLISTGSLTG
jgi:hypothetical protein